MLNNKNVLITGGGGMVGRSLVNLIKNKYPDTIITVCDIMDIDDVAIGGIYYVKADLRHFDECMRVCINKDYVFHLAGIKSSPKLTAEKPASFMVPMLQFNTNMMEAARLASVEWYLYTSTIGVYKPMSILCEDDVWETMPSKNDWFGGWAKRIGELQAEAYRIQYKKNNISIVRPANIYGPFDNFDLDTCMVIPALIRKFVDGVSPIEIWGDGSAKRDFIYTDDVAIGMLLAVEKKIIEPINLGVGVYGILSIKKLVEILKELTEYTGEVKYLMDKPMGDPVRCMDGSRADDYGFITHTNIREGLRKTIEWYKQNQNRKRYDQFKENT
jgi:GDP-L-fucose synthase